MAKRELALSFERALFLKLACEAARDEARAARRRFKVGSVEHSQAARLEQAYAELVDFLPLSQP